MNETAIITKNNALAPWASRDEVRELGKRIKELLPGGTKLAPHEALALAQSAVAHNLDPFNGEIWFIPGRGLMAGIKGHRRAAHQQLKTEGNGGGNYWSEFVGPLSDDEKTSLKIPKDALAFKCRLFDSLNIMTYTTSIEKMLKAGMPWEIVSNIMGQRPYTEGVGYWTSGENTKMTPVQCAQKRAEADALKRRFDLPFTIAVGVSGDSDIIAGEFVVQEESPEEVQEKMQAAGKALYGDADDDITQPISESQSNPPQLDESAKPATLKFQPFVTWANQWVQGNGKKYARKNDPNLADMYHLLGRIGKLGFAHVTEQNADEVKSTLESYVKQA